MLQTAVDIVGQQLPLAQTYAEYARGLYHNTFIGAGAQEIVQTAKSEVATANKFGKVALAVNGIYIGFEQLGGNEWLIGASGGHTLNTLHINPILEAVAAGGATGLTSLALVQAPLGALTAYNMGKFPKTAEKFQDWFGKDYESPKGPGRLKKFVTAMTFGSAATVIGESIKRPELNFRERAKVGLGSAAMIGMGVTGLGAGLGTVSKVLEHTGHPEAAHNLLDVVTNPLPWVGTFAVLNYLDWRKSKQPTVAEAVPTKLPESVAKEITPKRAWLAVGALALYKSKAPEAVQSDIANRLVHSAVGYLNRKGSLDIPA